MVLTFKKFVTRTLRGRCSIRIRYLNYNKIKNLQKIIINSAGRGSSGRRLLLSKGSLKYKKKSYIINLSFYKFNVLNMLVSLQYDTNRTTGIGLFFNIFGHWFYSLLTNELKFFDYVSLWKPELAKLSIHIENSWPRELLSYKLFSCISLIEINKKIKFARAAGAFGIIVLNNLFDLFTIIVLPSFNIKLLKNTEVAFPGYINNAVKIFFHYHKAGFNINKGYKATTRGTVKNACDHPNGGRTRALLLSRTPWGKIAKKPRHFDLTKILKKLKIARLKKTGVIFKKSNFVKEFPIGFLSRYILSKIKEYSNKMSRPQWKCSFYTKFIWRGGFMEYVNESTKKSKLFNKQFKYLIDENDSFRKAVIQKSSAIAYFNKYDIFRIYNGRLWFLRKIRRYMVSFKIGALVKTKKIPIFRKQIILKKKKRRDKKKGKKKIFENKTKDFEKIILLKTGKLRRTVSEILIAKS